MLPHLSCGRPRWEHRDISKLVQGAQTRCREYFSSFTNRLTIWSQHKANKIDSDLKGGKKNTNKKSKTVVEGYIETTPSTSTRPNTSTNTRPNTSTSTRPSISTSTSTTTSSTSATPLSQLAALTDSQIETQLQVSSKYVLFCKHLSRKNSYLHT